MNAKEIRGAILNSLYKRRDEHIIMLADVQDDTDLSEQDVRREGQYLYEKGLIETGHKTLAGFMSLRITSTGVDYIEDPSDANKPYSINVDASQNYFSNISNSTIAHKSDGVTQNIGDQDTIDHKNIEHLNGLIKGADAVIATHVPNPPNVIGFPTLKDQEFQQWKTRSENAIKAMSGAESSYLDNFKKSVKKGYVSHIESGKGILIALKEDMIAGFVISRNDEPQVDTVSAASVENNSINLIISERIYRHIKKYLDQEDYFHAVEESYKVVRERLREITGEERAIEIFNMNAESEKYHVDLYGYRADKGSAEGDFFRGVGYLNLAIQFLRNEKAHSLAAHIDKNLAIHYISLASLVYDLISGDKER